jgi:DNA-binding HxlR family transcriptional regulator
VANSIDYDGELSICDRTWKLVERRWSLRIVAELLRGPLRFSDIAERLPNASHKIISERLPDLIAAGLLVQRRLNNRLKVQVYELTEYGASLGKVIAALANFSCDAQLSLAPAEGKGIGNRALSFS